MPNLSRHFTPGRYICPMFHTPVDSLNDKYLRLFGIPISVVILLLAQMPFFYPGRWDLFWKYAVIGIVFTGLMWEISRLVLIRVRRRFPDLSQTRQRIGWMFLLFVLQLGIGQALIVKATFALGLAKIATLPFFKIWLINFAWSLFFIVVISSTYEAIYFFSQYKLAVQKAEHLKKQQVQQQLETLKNRVNPHFLFNSLTTLSALIGEDAAQAEQFVDELSKVYRYLLRAGRQPAASLGDELQFADSYAFLLKTRFEAGSFSMDTDRCRTARNLSQSDKDPKPISDTALLDRQLPVLSLQNALDYLVRTQNAPLHIRIDPNGQYLRIVCQNQPKSLSFDVSNNDWLQLENNGATQETQSGKLTILIPFTSNPPMA